MAYCTKADVFLRMSALDVATLTNGYSEDDIADALIADADAEIDLWVVTASWTAAQLRAASVALVIVAMWERRPDVSTPSAASEKAARWRALFSIAPTAVISGVIYNPMLDEDDDELSVVLSGPS